MALAALDRIDIVATIAGRGWLLADAGRPIGAFLLGLGLVCGGVCGGSACSASPAGPVGASEQRSRASHAPTEPSPPATSHAVPHTRSADVAIRCTYCEDWNRPREPFKIFANTYYVGPAGLSSVLITSSAGHILLDGGLPQSAAVIAANIEKLGFHLADVRVIANSHAHYDHAGGIASLQESSGARVIASDEGAIALEAGQPTDDDPQARSGQDPALRFPPVAQVEVVRDGQAIAVGDVSLVAHYTPGHTPGSTTWTWRSCEAGRCMDLVYADSLNPVSDDGFRFTGDTARSSVVAAFLHSIEVVEHLPCDIMISVHPEFTNIDDKLAARAKGASTDPFIDPGMCQSYAADARQKLMERVAAEQADDPLQGPASAAVPDSEPFEVRVDAVITAETRGAKVLAVGADPRFTLHMRIERVEPETALLAPGPYAVVIHSPSRAFRGPVPGKGKRIHFRMTIVPPRVDDPHDGAFFSDLRLD